MAGAETGLRSRVNVRVVTHPRTARESAAREWRGRRAGDRKVGEMGRRWACPLARVGSVGRRVSFPDPSTLGWPCPVGGRPAGDGGRGDWGLSGGGGADHREWDDGDCGGLCDGGALSDGRPPGGREDNTRYLPKDTACGVPLDRYGQRQWRCGRWSAHTPARHVTQFDMLHLAGVEPSLSTADIFTRWMIRGSTGGGPEFPLTDVCPGSIW